MQEISLSTKQKYKKDRDHKEIFKKLMELFLNIFFFKLQSMVLKKRERDFTLNTYSCRVVMEIKTSQNST